MKRIVVCCDGTWNKPGTRDRGAEVKTNVEKIYLSVGDGTEEFPQVKFYGQGVGTGFSIKNHFFGGSFGRGIDSNIQDAYKFIMWNFSPGDELFLFGFSRGAYTVRSLAGLIRNCGIMKPQYLQLVEEAYHLYRDRSGLTQPKCDLMKAFRKSYGFEEETRIRFIGVWDTVGALGIPISTFNWYNTRYHFHDVKLSSQIDYAYHALAIDEKRKIFEPSLWELDESTSSTENENGTRQVCQQVWFPGVHSNVGGGYADSGLSDIALDWMIGKAKKVGLKFDENEIAKIKASSCGELRNSVTGFFKMTPQITRNINKGIVKKKDPSTGELKDMPAITNESIHYTCFERCHKEKTYHPENVFEVYHKTPFDPGKEDWEQPWLQYLEGFEKMKS